MSFQAYTERIMNLREYQQGDKKLKKMIQRRFQVQNTKMKMVSIKKSQFTGLSDKKYYFSDGITSLPYGHLLLEPISEKKKNLRKFKNIFKKINMIF